MVRADGQPADIPPLEGFETGPELKRVSDTIADKMKVRIVTWKTETIFNFKNAVGLDWTPDSHPPSQGAGGDQNDAWICACS